VNTNQNTPDILLFTNSERVNMDTTEVCWWYHQININWYILLDSQ